MQLQTISYDNTVFLHTIFISQAAPVLICEIKNAFDSDGTILDAIDANKQEQDIVNNQENILNSVLIDSIGMKNL